MGQRGRGSGRVGKLSAAAVTSKIKSESSLYSYIYGSQAGLVVILLLLDFCLRNIFLIPVRTVFFWWVLGAAAKSVICFSWVFVHDASSGVLCIFMNSLASSRTTV